MKYTEEILKRLLQELIDKREYFIRKEGRSYQMRNRDFELTSGAFLADINASYSQIDYNDDSWRKGVDKCDKEIEVVKFLLKLIKLFS